MTYPGLCPTCGGVGVTYSSDGEEHSCGDCYDDGTGLSKLRDARPPWLRAPWYLRLWSAIRWRRYRTDPVTPIILEDL